MPGPCFPRSYTVLCLLCSADRFSLSEQALHIPPNQGIATGVVRQPETK